MIAAFALATFGALSLARSESRSDPENLRSRQKWYSFWFNMVVVAISGLIIAGSYNTYLDQRAFYDATMEQYASAITMYKNYAEIDVKTAAWTDLKYQGYQDNIADLIKNLRNRIIKYNEAYVKKNKLHANLFYSWFVVGMDEDMKIIKMKIASER